MATDLSLVRNQNNKVLEKKKDSKIVAERCKDKKKDKKDKDRKDKKSSKKHKTKKSKLDDATENKDVESKRSEKNVGTKKKKSKEGSSKHKRGQEPSVEKKGITNDVKENIPDNVETKQNAVDTTGQTATLKEVQNDALGCNTDLTLTETNCGDMTKAQQLEARLLKYKMKKQSEALQRKPVVADYHFAEDFLREKEKQTNLEQESISCKEQRKNRKSKMKLDKRQDKIKQMELNSMDNSIRNHTDDITCQLTITNMAKAEHEECKLDLSLCDLKDNKLAKEQRLMDRLIEYRARKESESFKNIFEGYLKKKEEKENRERLEQEQEHDRDRTASRKGSRRRLLRHRSCSDIESIVTSSSSRKIRSGRRKIQSKKCMSSDNLECLEETSRLLEEEVAKTMQAGNEILLGAPHSHELVVPTTDPTEKRQKMAERLIQYRAERVSKSMQNLLNL